MATYSVKNSGNGTLEISGDLDFDSVPDLLKESKAWFHSSEELIIDLAGIRQANSAGMAILIEWKSLAEKQNSNVTFLNLPETILHLADVCKTETLLLS